jgi:hypothetical protein
MAAIFTELSRSAEKSIRLPEAKGVAHCLHCEVEWMKSDEQTNSREEWPFPVVAFDHLQNAM